MVYKHFPLIWRIFRMDQTNWLRLNNSSKRYQIDERMIIRSDEDMLLNPNIILVNSSNDRNSCIQRLFLYITNNFPLIIVGILSFIPFRQQLTVRSTYLVTRWTGTIRKADKFIRRRSVFSIWDTLRNILSNSFSFSNWFNSNEADPWRKQ